MKLKIERSEVRVSPSVRPTSQLRFEYGPHVLVLRVESRARLRVRKLFLLMAFRHFKTWIRDLEKCEIVHTDSKSWINWIRDPEQSPSFRQVPRESGAGDKLGLKLRFARLKLGLTLDEMARRTGVSPKHLSKIEHGHHCPHQATLWRIKSALRITPNDLPERALRPRRGFKRKNPRPRPRNDTQVTPSTSLAKILHENSRDLDSLRARVAPAPVSALAPAGRFNQPN